MPLVPSRTGDRRVGAYDLVVVAATIVGLVVAAAAAAVKFEYAH